MSFYSALILAANEGIQVPSPEAVRLILTEVGMVEPSDGEDDEFGNLTAHVKDLFRDPAAQAENDRFFRPDSIGLSEGVEVSSPEGDELYDGPGWSIHLHGQGYLWPWDLATLRDRVARTPALVRLRSAVEAEFGGRFVFPPTERAFLRSRLVDDSGRWLWFASESM